MKAFISPKRDIIHILGEVVVSAFQCSPWKGKWRIKLVSLMAKPRTFLFQIRKLATNKSHINYYKRRIVSSV